MPLRNRVTPCGDIIAINERGTLMGNRGILHDNNRNIVRRAMHKGWIICLLEFEGNSREVMSSGKYTELFFLDEASALSAGHRPCCECQNKRYLEFKRIWLTVNSRVYPIQRYSMAEIDSVIHKERIDRRGTKVTFYEKVSNLPDGTFVEIAERYFLKWQDQFVEWSYGGYLSAITLPGHLEVKVLTPRSIVRCFKTGFIPNVHGSVYGKLGCNLPNSCA